MGSLSESAGLKAGDVILNVNEIDVMRLRHQEALDAISQAGNQFQLNIGRYNQNVFFFCFFFFLKKTNKSWGFKAEIAGIFSLLKRE